MDDMKKYWMRQAYSVAAFSPDPSTQNGAILVVEYSETSSDFTTIIGKACNTFPAGVECLPERLEKPLKYSMIEHAERGAIYNAAFNGFSTSGSTMIVPWAACADCARAIICAGVSKIICHQDMMDKTPDRWKESIDVAFRMLDEAEVECEMISGSVGGPELLFNGEIWTP